MLIELKEEPLVGRALVMLLAVQCAVMQASSPMLRTTRPRCRRCPAACSAGCTRS